MSVPPPVEIASLRDEWAVLVNCTSPVANSSRLAGLLGAADWQRLLLLAEEHGVLALLTDRLRTVDRSLVPPEIRQTLLERHRAQIFFTLRMTVELFRILDRFAAQQIAALVVKGPVLALRAYGDPAMRSYGDLDLLVRQRNIRRATEILTAAGYMARVAVRSIDAGKIPGQYLFSKADSKLIVELHNDLTLRYFPRRLPLERFFASQTRVSLDSHEAPALALEDELVLICIHGAKHFWERLMWIADVAALVSRQSSIDWNRAFASAEEVGAERMLRTGLRLAADLLQAPLPPKVLTAVKSDHVASRLAAEVLQWLPAAGYAPPGLFERALFRMRMRGGWIAGPAYLLRLSFSPTEEDWSTETDDSRQGFFDVLRRPFRLARKYGRGNKT